MALLDFLFMKDICVMSRATFYYNDEVVFFQGSSGVIVVIDGAAWKYEKHMSYAKERMVSIKYLERFFFGETSKMRILSLMWFETRG